MPEASDAEVVSWMYDLGLYRAAYPASGRNDGLSTFRNLVGIGHERDARRIHITYRGAATPEDAVAATTALADTAVARARVHAGTIIAGDLAYYQERLAAAEAAVNRARAAVVERSQLTGIVAPNEAARTRVARARDLSVRAADLQAELAYLDQRIVLIPQLLQELPAK